MPHFNIHWKGCPHHRLPRIRVASTPRNSIRARSQTAAKQVLQIPLGNALEQARTKERFNFRFRRRRGRSSRSTSAIVRSRRQAAQRARQHIQAFGLGTSQVERGSRATFEISTLENLSVKARVITRSSAALRNPQPQGKIPSTDGVASSSIKRIKASKREPEKLYSLVYVDEVPVYKKSSTTADQNKSSFNSNRLNIHSTKKPGAEYPHLGPLKAVIRESTHRDSQAFERRRMYDCRVDPKKRVEELRSKSSPAQIRAVSQAVPEKKQPGRTCSELPDTVNSLALQTKTKRIDTLFKTVVPPVLSDNASRTSSQRKTLKKFTREIELYVQACSSVPKGSLVATPSMTTISAHTVDEFKPYQAQFQSAGLAVTSDEQRGLVKLWKEPSPPPTPPKDSKWPKKVLPSDDDMVSRNNKQTEKSQKFRDPSYDSGSTGTTVIGFTPPHEKSYPRPRTAQQPSSNSDHTIIDFTPPHERVAPSPSRPSPSAPKAPTKKSLPWLRRADSSPEHIFPHQKNTAPPETEEDGLSTSLGGWFANVEVLPEKGKGPESVRKSGPSNPPRSDITLHSTNFQWNRMEYGREKTVAKKQPKTPTQQAQVSTQTDDVDAEAMENSLNAATYADKPTQTNVDFAASPPTVQETKIKTGEVKMTRASMIRGYNTTFPLTESSCKGDCNTVSEPIAASSMLKSRKLSMMKWEGLDREIQTDNLYSIGPQLGENQSRQNRKITSKLELKGSEPKLTFSPPSIWSPTKCEDGQIFQACTTFQNWVESSALSTENDILPLTPRESSHMLCTTSSNEPKLAALELDLQPEPQWKLEPDPEAASRVGTNHSCTSRQTLVCQQCFPSRQTSTIISPLQNFPRGVQYAPSRRSTRPIVPARSVTYLEEPSRPSTRIGESVKGGPPPAESFQQVETVKDIATQYTNDTPIADPMKKPSLPRLRLKLLPALERKQYSTTSRLRPAPPASQPATVINFPTQHPDLTLSSSLDTVPLKSGEIPDKQVFKGIHVATAAACDEDVDKWIEEITGYGVRKFLADLSRFEGLGINTLADIAKRAAKQRRERLKAWESVREARITQHDAGEERDSK